MQEYYLITFESTHAAMATEKLLKPAGARIMPVPRFISASCGIAIRIDSGNRKQAEALFCKESTLKPGEYTYYHIVRESSAGHEDNTKCEEIKMICM